MNAENKTMSNLPIVDEESTNRAVDPTHTTPTTLVAKQRGAKLARVEKESTLPATDVEDQATTAHEPNASETYHLFDPDIS